MNDTTVTKIGRLKEKGDIPGLILIFRDGSPEARQAALAALEGLGDAAVQHLKVDLMSPYKPISRMAATILSELKYDLPEMHSAQHTEEDQPSFRNTNDLGEDVRKIVEI